MSEEEICCSATARSAVAGTILLGWCVNDVLLCRQTMVDRTRVKLRRTLQSSMTLQ